MKRVKKIEVKSSFTKIIEDISEIKAGMYLGLIEPSYMFDSSICLFK